jgi:hypothetical protein
MAVEDLRDQIARLPEQPGVYLWGNAGGKTIYVGKARSLRDRVRSYLGAWGTSPRHDALLTEIATLEEPVERQRDTRRIYGDGRRCNEALPIAVRGTDDSRSETLSLVGPKDYRWPVRGATARRSEMRQICRCHACSGRKRRRRNLAARAGANYGPPGGPFEETGVCQRIQHVPAVVGAKPPEPHRLRQRQLETRHLHEFRGPTSDSASHPFYRLRRSTSSSALGRD